jgi:hypothetical protein
LTSNNQGKCCKKKLSVIFVHFSLSFARVEVLTFYTECARDRDLYNLVSFGKFVNDILFSTIYKTHYLTLGHHALAVILCLCVRFFWVISSLIVLTKPKKPKKLGVQYFFLLRSKSLTHPVALRPLNLPFKNSN